MKSRHHHLALASAILAAFSSPARAAALIWDTIPGDGTTITAGGGNWDTSTVVWNNAGTDVAWSQTSATAATNTATFAGADGSEGAYPVIVSTGIATQSLTFSSSGYALSAAASRTITHTSQTLSIASDKSATIGNHITASFSTTGGASNITGGGTLNIAGTGATVSKPSNLLNIIGGTTVNVGTSGLLTTSSQVLIGTNSGSGTVIVDGGTVSSTTGTASHNLILANASTTNTATGTLTINSGTVTHPAISGGLRFGSTTALTSPNTATGILNLNGGEFTVARIFEGGADPGILSTINFNGGKLIVRAGSTNAANFMTGLDTANVLSGGAIIDTNGVNTTIAQALLDGGGGGLTKEGTGILTLTGANTYTGATIINGGKLNLNAPYSSVTATTVNHGGRLGVTTGASASSIPSITMNTGGGFEVNTGSYNASTLAGISTTTFNNNDDYVVDLTGENIVPGDITVLTYGSKTGTGTPTLGSLPPGVTGTVSDTGSAIIIDVDTPQAPSIVWSAGTGEWDTATANWTGATYTEGAVVTFPEIAGDNIVTLTAARSPFSVAISNNTTSTYTFNSAAIAGPATVAKTGTGAVTFDVANSYTGTTTVSSGGLIVNADAALGAAAAGTTIASGAALGLRNGVTYSTAEPVSGSGVSNTAALGAFAAVQRGFVQAISGDCTFAGPIEINATGVSRIGVQNGARLTLSGPITAKTGVTGVIVLIRAGSTDGDFVTLSNGGSSWDGETRIFTENAGTGAGLKLGIDNGLPAATSVVAGGGTSGTGNTFDLNGFDQTLNGLTWSNGTLHIRNNAAATTSVLILNPAANANNAGAGNLSTIEDGEGTVALVKDGAFSQNLEGVHTYSGTTTINGGNLSLGPAATIDNSTSMTIAAGATFNVLAKASYAIPASMPVTLKLDPADAGSAGSIKAAADLDISSAIVTLDPVATLDDPVYILAEYTNLTGKPEFGTVSGLPSGYSIDYAYNSGTQIALVADSVPGYLAWIAGFPVGSENQSGDDPDNDGIENLLEFVLNGDPTTSDPSIFPTLDSSGSTFVFAFDRRDDSLSPETTLTFQYATDLSNWTDVVVAPESGTVGAATITVTDGSPVDRISISIPKAEAGPGGKLFGRLEVVKP